MVGRLTTRRATALQPVHRFHERGTSRTWTPRSFLRETFLKRQKVRFHLTAVFFRATSLRLKMVRWTPVLLDLTLTQSKIFTPQCDVTTGEKATLATLPWGSVLTIALYGFSTEHSARQSFIRRATKVVIHQNFFDQAIRSNILMRSATLCCTRF